MKTRDSFVYMLFDKNKKAMYIDANGHLQLADDDYLRPDGVPAYLQNSPEGWMETLIKYARNTKYLGLFRDYTTPMSFSGDGYEILRSLMWIDGFEAVCYFGIAKLDRLSLPYKYQTWYLTEIDFSKYSQALTQIKVSAIEGGLSKFLKAFESTAYEIDLDENMLAKRILLDGVKFDFNKVFQVGEQDLYAVPNYILGMVPFSSEGNQNNYIVYDVFPQQAAVYPNESFFSASQFDQDVVISGKVLMQYFEDDAFELRVEMNNGSDTNAFPQYVCIPMAATSRPDATIEEFTFSNIAFTIPAGWRTHMKIFTASNTGGLLQMRVLDGEIKVDYKYTHPQTFVKGIYIKELLDALLDKMTKGVGGYTIKSNWLTAKKDILVTSGDGLRNIEKSKIKISFADVFKSLQFAGLGIEGNFLRIEQLDFFFNTSKTIKLGAVKDAVMVVAEDLIGNVLKAGYEKQDYEDVNGKFEVNQGQVWSTIITKIIKDLDYVSPIRADALGIELLRINFGNKTTTDSGSDNDTFFINVETPTVYSDDDGPYYKLWRPAYTSVTGLANWETYFNLELSPKKNLLRWGRYFRSLFDKLDASYIEQTSADKNTDIVTVLNGITVAEKEKIQVGSLGDKLFLPYYFTFTTETLVNSLELIDIKPYDQIEFEWKGKLWYGFMWDGGIKPYDNEPQNWKLIAAPQNDMSKW